MQYNDYQKNRLRELPEYISVISHKSCARIKIDDIEIIQQEGRQLRVFATGKEYIFYGSLSTIAESLAERSFFRPMKRMIINFDHISDISGYTVNFVSGQSVAMGKNALALTKRAYKQYLMKYPPYTLWEPIINTEGRVAERGDIYKDISESNIIETEIEPLDPAEDISIDRRLLS